MKNRGHLRDESNRTREAEYKKKAACVRVRVHVRARVHTLKTGPGALRSGPGALRSTETKPQLQESCPSRDPRREQTPPATVWS